MKKMNDVYEEIRVKAQNVRSEINNEFISQADINSELDKESSRRLIDKFIGRLDKMFYDYELSDYLEEEFRIQVCCAYLNRMVRKQKQNLFTRKMEEIIDLFLDYVFSSIFGRREYKSEEAEEKEVKAEEVKEEEENNIEQKINRLDDFIKAYIEEDIEALKNGGSDVMEEDVRYKDTDSALDPTEKEILRQGKLPWESDYGTEEKYYLIASPLSVAKAHLYGCDLIADYEIRKERLSYNEQSLGKYLVYVGTYDDCVKYFNEHAEEISQILTDTKIYFRCTGTKTFKGRGV